MYPYGDTNSICIVVCLRTTSSVDTLLANAKYLLGGRTCTHIRTPYITHAPTLVHTHTHAYTHSHTRAYTHSHIRIHSQTHTLTHTRIHYTHTHTLYTHTLIHYTPHNTYTNTQSPASQSKSCSSITHSLISLCEIIIITI